LARAPGGQMQGAATQAMPLCIVEERQRRRCPPAAAPLWAEARWLRCSLLTYHTGYARRSRLASWPGGLSKVQTLFIDRPLMPDRMRIDLLARPDGNR